MYICTYTLSIAPNSGEKKPLQSIKWGSIVQSVGSGGWG